MTVTKATLLVLLLQMFNLTNSNTSSTAPVPEIYQELIDKFNQWIGKLGSHNTTLYTIENRVAVLQGQVDELSKEYRMCQKDVERLSSSTQEGEGKVLLAADTVSLLLTENAIRKVDDKGNTALHIEARSGHTEAVEKLLNFGAQYNAKNIYGFTPLHRAAGGGHADTCKALLKAGAWVNEKANSRATALHVAAQDGHLDVCRLLLDNGALINALDNENWTPLHKAVNLGRTEIVQLLVDRGANKNLTDSSGHTPLAKACDEQLVEVINILSMGESCPKKT